MRLLSVVILLMACVSAAAQRDSAGRPSIVKMLPIPKKEKQIEAQAPPAKQRPAIGSSVAEMLARSEAAGDPNEETFRQNLRKQVAAQASGPYIGSRWYTQEQLDHFAVERQKTWDRVQQEIAEGAAKRAKQQAEQQALSQQVYRDWHERYIADAPVRAEIEAAASQERTAWLQRDAAWAQERAADRLRWAAMDFEWATDNLSRRPCWGACDHQRTILDDMDCWQPWSY